jgi:hypothetical protein
MRHSIEHGNTEAFNAKFAEYEMVQDILHREQLTGNNFDKLTQEGANKLRIIFIDKKLVPLVYDLANDSGEHANDKFQKLMDATLSVMVKPFYKRARIIQQTFFVKLYNEYDLDVVLSALSVLNGQLDVWLNLFRNSENYRQFSGIIESRIEELRRLTMGNENVRERVSNFFFCKWLAYKREYRIILLEDKHDLGFFPLSGFPYSSKNNLPFLRRVITELFANEVQYLETEYDKYRFQSDYAIREDFEGTCEFLIFLEKIKMDIMIPNELRNIDILIQLNRCTEDIIRALSAQLIEFTRKKLGDISSLNLLISNLEFDEQSGINNLRGYAIGQVERINIIIGELKTEQIKQQTQQRNYTIPQVDGLFQGVDLKKIFGFTMFTTYNPRRVFSFTNNPQNENYTDLSTKESLRIVVDILPRYSKLIITMLKAFNLFFRAIPVSRSFWTVFMKNYVEFILEVKRKACKIK